jgi:hypothetical protein
MALYRIVSLIRLLVVSPALLAGQHIPPTTTPAFDFGMSSRPSDPAAAMATRQALPHASNLFPKAPDHRWEGVVVGGVVLGLAGVVVASSFCDHDGQQQDNCAYRVVGSGLVGAVIGTVVGGLIGGLIPKKSP